MDQLIQAIGLNQGQAIPGAPSPITGQELLLRALGAALPPPGQLRVPATGVGRTAGTLARIGAGLAGAKAEDLQRLRLDPNALKQQRFIEALQAIPFKPALGRGQADISVTSGQPQGGSVQVGPSLPSFPARTFAGAVARVPQEEREAQFGLGGILGPGAVFQPERVISRAPGTELTTEAGRVIRPGTPLPSRVERFLPVDDEPGIEALFQLETNKTTGQVTKTEIPGTRKRVSRPLTEQQILDKEQRSEDRQVRIAQQRGTEAAKIAGETKAKELLLPPSAIILDRKTLQRKTLTRGAARKGFEEGNLAVVTSKQMQ